LISAASRTAVALGYHEIRDVNPKTDYDREVLLAMLWCSHLDRVMSFLLVRPMSLPHLHIAPASMVDVDPSNHATLNFAALLELAPVHERWVRLSLETRIGYDQKALKDEVSQLKEDMKVVWTKLQEVWSKEFATLRTDTRQAKALNESHMDGPTTLEWVGNEFEYWSTMTAVYRLSPTVTTHPEREECLNCARTALNCALEIARIGSQVDNHTEDFNPHLNWLV
jgi:hypothetical protein